MDLELPFPPTPEYMSQHAAHIVDVVGRVEGLALDYSVDSLALVDELLGRFHEAGDDPEQVAETLFQFGCYIGEVIVRVNEGSWVSVDEDHPMAGWPVVMLPGPNMVNPIGKAFKRVAHGEGESVVYFYQAVVAR